jgi:hypothetical protein
VVKEQILGAAIDETVVSPRLFVVTTRVISAPLVSRADYIAHLADLRAAQGLPESVSAETAEAVAGVLLRRRYPASVIAMRSRTQRWGNSGIEAA